MTKTETAEMKPITKKAKKRQVKDEVEQDTMMETDTRDDEQKPVTKKVKKEPGTCKTETTEKESVNRVKKDPGTSKTTTKAETDKEPTTKKAKTEQGTGKTKTNTETDTAEKKQITKKAKKERGAGKVDSWNVHFNECNEYREKFGHCKIPTSYKDNKKLGVWVQEQRRNFKLTKQGKKPRVVLSDEQIEKLDGIGFHWGWTPDPNLSAESNASWETNFEKLKAYKESHGDFDIPMESDSLGLAKWARVQRNQNNLRATKRKCFITKERIEKLDEIGFDWEGPRKIN